MTSQNKNRLLYILLIANLALSTFYLLSDIINVRFSTEPTAPPQERIISIDTTAPPPIIIQMPRQPTPKPIIVYVDSTGRSVPTAKIDTSKHEKANLYRDSIEDENLTLYYESTVKGSLLNNALDYKLKIPKLITKKIEVLKPVPTPVNTLMLTGGVGGNVNQFSSVRLGLQFVSAKGWAVGYDYDVLQNVHSVNVGVRLFGFGAKGK
ncbi:hypothetical protein [Aureispira sp. CCB-E]|uniref:hypothetical protein n=1 Tax=Aureispira sp. CCB-E TaxID=3051121 RepID=UPI002868663F|nr:hypothetical protein [Aureispira sp. CCB-E]WMX16551.1 hypothetical protein QP953_09245 [Aureispira sp. CCB-E]